MTQRAAADRRIAAVVGEGARPLAARLSGMFECVMPTSPSELAHVVALRPEVVLIVTERVASCEAFIAALTSSARPPATVVVTVSDEVGRLARRLSVPALDPRAPAASLRRRIEAALLTQPNAGDE